MTEEPDSIVPVMLRRIDARTERMEHDLHDLKLRVTNLEENVAGVNRRLDRLEERVDRTEKQFGLIDA